MTGDPRWVSLPALLAIHARLLAEHGGSPGLRDRGLLESALDSPRNRHVHGERDIHVLAGAYAYTLAQDYPFVSGNKQAALTAADIFLETNGFTLEAPERDAVQMMLALSSGNISEVEFATWIRTNSRAT